jgi:NAD(P)-dependent dehydrogenase (short-subunit alcohol dehydrogenase family)
LALSEGEENIPQMSLVGRVALVTGAASGLGKATALRFAKQGARVVLVDFVSSSGTSVAESIGGPSTAIFSGGDVTSEKDIALALDAAQSAFGAPPSIVVNCAGIAPPKLVLGKKGVHPLDHFAKILTVNAVGTFNVCRLAAERMAAQPPLASLGSGERGVLINTASVAAFDGQIGQAAYSASKGAVWAMMLPMARELAKSGIRVCTIAPGVFLTPMVEGLPPKVQDDLGAQVPFPSRLGRPDEYAQLAQHIVENQMLNGECIRLDGALRMPP